MKEGENKKDIKVEQLKARSEICNKRMVITIINTNPKVARKSHTDKLLQQQLI